MAFSFIPREEKFFDLFEQQAKSILEAAVVFRELVTAWSPKGPGIQRLRDLEHECDITTHEIIDRLNRTFVTPFDREDIYSLAKELDDVVDILQSISERLVLYNINQPYDDFIGMARIMEDAVSNVASALNNIRHMNRPRRILDHCIEINRLENSGDRTLERALGNLFKSNTDPMEVIKWKELYDTIESGIDKCEDIANTIEGILVKHG